MADTDEKKVDTFLAATTDPEGAKDSSSEQDLLASGSHDPVLVRKMALVNDALDEIGFTSYHLKLFFLNGWGYLADSMVLLVQSYVGYSAYYEFGLVGYKRALTMAVYVGMLLGALFWGFSADVIGRRLAFNVTLAAASIATVIAGVMPTWNSLAVMIAIVGFAAGGNLILDTAIFLEYSPSRNQWMITLMALFWGVGQSITAIAALIFLVPGNLNCTEAIPVVTADQCSMSINMGWRYVAFTCGGIMFIGSLLRIFLVNLKETPKYLLGANRDEEVIEVLEHFSKSSNRTFSLTLQQLKDCGEVKSSHSAQRMSVSEVMLHITGLFEHFRLGLSTSLIILSWAGIGLIYPLFYVFLPEFVSFSYSTYDGWKNAVITNVVSIFGPVLAAYMVEIPVLGRKWTMVLGALTGMICLFLYAADKSEAADISLSALSGFFINVYYATLYAYTPEVLPSAHRTTGNGLSVAANRVMGIVSAIIGTFANTHTTIPVYICAGLFAFLAFISFLFPYEPRGKRSS
ncbi:hexose transporter [Zopfochytrium polystomum]|nr:hexose transporter [Zopfochytrium polystomum]